MNNHSTSALPSHGSGLSLRSSSSSNGGGGGGSNSGPPSLGGYDSAPAIGTPHYIAMYMLYIFMFYCTVTLLIISSLNAYLRWYLITVTALYLWDVND